MNRLLGGVLSALTILLLVAAPVAAGGWATVTPDDPAAEPVAGEPVDLGFTVLQHGETPAPWVNATVVATNAVTGESVKAAATSTGSDGHFAATLTVPEPGLWTWRVELTDLENASSPTALTVREADGSLPALDATTLVAVVERARTEVRAELRAEYQARLDLLERESGTRRSEALSFDNRLDAAAAERDALQGRIDRLETGGASAALSPLTGLAVALIAVLAGALTAFAMVALSRPKEPQVVPAGSDPVAQDLAASR